MLRCIHLALLVVALGCGPAPGDSDGDGEGDESTAGNGSSTPTTTSSSATSTSAGESTTSFGTTSGGAHTGGPTTVDTSTTEPCYEAEPCPLPGGAFAEVAGTTPLGEFTGAFAWVGLFHGECAGISIAMTPTLEGFEEDVACEFAARPDPALMLFVPDLLDADCAIDRPFSLVHVLDGAEAMTTPVVEITMCEPVRPGVESRIEGSVTATGDGWDVAGTFVAEHCGNLDVACP
jgi:hypothetical protein